MMIGKEWETAPYFYLFLKKLYEKFNTDKRFRNFK